MRDEASDRLRKNSVFQADVEATEGTRALVRHGRGWRTPPDFREHPRGNKA